MGSTKEAEFNPSLFKRSIFGTILYGICVVIAVAQSLDWFAYQSQPIVVRAPQSMLPISLCYAAGLSLLLGSLMLVLMVSKPQFTMSARYRPLIATTIAATCIIALAADNAYSFIIFRDYRSRNEVIILNAAVDTTLYLICTGFVFWALMLPVNSKSCLARWLRPFHSLPEREID